jgi:C-terminal processing protease CtpA/Prc
MLGEERGVAGVVVKQLVPRGSADRTGRVSVGDQLLRVSDEDVSRQTVSNMRHLIIGRPVPERACPRS